MEDWKKAAVDPILLAPTARSIGALLGIIAVLVFLLWLVDK